MKRSLPFLAFSLVSLVACTADVPDDEAEDTGVELKKKVTPKGTEGKLELAKPAWATPAYDAGLVFAGNYVKLGDVVPKPPGSYSLVLGASSTSIGITAGTTQTVTPGGLLVRYAQPIQSKWFEADQIVVSSQSGHAIKKGPTPVHLAVFPGAFSVRAPAHAWNGNVTAGLLTEVTIPTANVTVAVDPIDPAYPSAVPDCLRLRTLRTDIDTYPNYTSSRWSVSPPLRELGSAPVGVPAGNAVRLVTGGASASSSYGITELAQWPVIASSSTTITIHRLEVDHVTSPTPGAPSLQGSFTIDMKRNGVWTPYSCGQGVPTHSGVDLPDGDYRVTTTANGPSGVITHVEEISFP
jgi:hypothetical protein